MKRFLTIALGLLLALPAGATDPVPIAVTLKHERNRVTVQARADKPIHHNLRLSSSGKMLVLELAPARLKTGSATRLRVERGLIGTLRVRQANAHTVQVLVPFVSAPRRTVRRTAEGRQLTLEISTSEMAADSAAGAVKSVPPTPRAGKPAAAKPAEPGTPPPEPPDEPLGESAASPPQAPAAPAAAVPPAEQGRTYTHTFAGIEVREALATLAGEMGLSLEMDESIRGPVTLSFYNADADTAIRTVLASHPATLKHRIRDGRLEVWREREAPPPRPARVREYFPITDTPAADVAEHVRSFVPGAVYRVDPRLNTILVEGTPEQVDRLRKILQRISRK